MTSRWMRMSFVAGLAFTLGLAACDSPRNLTAPVDNSDMMSSDMMMKEGNNGKALGHSKKDELHAVQVDVSGLSRTYDFVAGVQGGTFGDNDYFQVIVPKHAVKNGTHFVITLDVNDEIVIHATATSRKSDHADDVGEKGFNPALTFRINVGRYGVTSPNVVLAWRNPANGKLTATTTRLITDWVVAEVSHFTDWVIAE